MCVYLYNIVANDAFLKYEHLLIFKTIAKVYMCSIFRFIYQFVFSTIDSIQQISRHEEKNTFCLMKIERLINYLHTICDLSFIYVMHQERGIYFINNWLITHWFRLTYYSNIFHNESLSKEFNNKELLVFSIDILFN